MGVFSLNFMSILQIQNLFMKSSLLHEVFNTYLQENIFLGSCEVPGRMGSSSRCDGPRMEVLLGLYIV